ncbi:phospho-acceptor domain-containing protein [Tahibacter aquaticus]|uniref:histidine kinase n=1 Tax=Tahibacter aquaticus TaxID=520092 RepID=A0A4R6YNR7_9GAMM|nr:ATP-binding protein [Tahibacter aquaticus]TDR39203.1 phospho-acceptor domain-containing protein [Tahibacter aquaticus]
MPQSSTPRLHAALDAVGTPLLLLQGSQVAHANPAALRLAESLAGGQGDPELRLRELVDRCRSEHGNALPGRSLLLPLAGEDAALALLLDYEPLAPAAQPDGSELELALARLNTVQEQLVQSEKMASLGQLAAGIAHEINNPIGYVHSNLGTLQEYLNNLFGLIECCDSVISQQGVMTPERRAEVAERKRAIDFGFLVQDLPQLLAESREGIDRVRRIVQDLRDFSRVDRLETWSLYDLHRGLDSTLGIVWNEVKYKAEVRKEYGNLPLVECLPSQINQVFVNILVNAAQAIEQRGEIVVRTGTLNDTVWIEIADNGSGIAADNLKRIFDPFFTTKPVGKGTGLGLSISYGIVHKHHGDIAVESQPGRGTTFRIVLPQRQAA